MGNIIIDEWKYRNTSVTKKDADKLFDLRYYLGVQLRFFDEVDVGKLPASRYLEDVRQIQSVLTKIGVADSCMENDVQLILSKINTTIELLEKKYCIS